MTLHSGVELGSENCTCNDKPAQHMCFFFLPLWHSGCRATWHLSTDIFQVFSFNNSFCSNFLGHIRTLPRTPLHSESVFVAHQAENYLLSQYCLILSLFMHICRFNSFWTGGSFLALISKLLTEQGKWFLQWSQCYLGGSDRPSHRHPMHLCLCLAFDSFFFKFTF